MQTRTTTDLLEDLADPANQPVWQEFDERYRPVLVGLARRLGLGAEDAADAAQETLTRFVRAYRNGGYDRSRGRLRSWIIGILKNCVRDLRDAQVRRRELRGTTVLQDLPGEDRLAGWWESECEQEVLRRAVQRLRRETDTEPRTIRAFEMIAFDRRRPTEVAESLSMTTNDVYLAKHRCLKRLRGIIAELSLLYEMGQ